MQPDPMPSSPVDPGTFRSVLGNYPTGVVVVTARSATGDPVGMVIGSFTSVSLDPPLVAYLPTRSSGSYAQIKDAPAFCINVLAADQEDLCRTLAVGGERKFDGVAWREAPSGAPILDGVVAWIDCVPAGVHDGGDHDIVLGRTTELKVERDALPLVFFQGGYGRFVPGSLVMAGSSRHLVAASRLAAEHRAELEQLSMQLGCQCTVVALDADEGVFVAAAAPEGQPPASPVGARIPVTAPVQPLFVEPMGPLSRERWMAGLGRDEAGRARAGAVLERAHARGWSVTLASSTESLDLDAFVSDYAANPRTPSRDRAFFALVDSLPLVREPEVIHPESEYLTVDIAVPVTEDDGEVRLVLRVGPFARPISGRALLESVRHLQEAASRFSGGSA